MNVPFMSSVTSLPPIDDIVGALNQAEEISKFLRQQTDFWMEQVRQIEQSHSGRGAGVANSASSSHFMVPPRMPLLSATGLAASSGSATSGSGASAPLLAAAPAAPAGPEAPAVPQQPAAQQPSAPQPAAPQQPAAQQPATAAVGAGGAAASSSGEAGSAASGGGDGGAEGGAGDQMAELRKAQQERWKRTNSSLSQASVGSGASFS